MISQCHRWPRPAGFSPILVDWGGDRLWGVPPAQVSRILYFNALLHPFFRLRHSSQSIWEAGGGALSSSTNNQLLWDDRTTGQDSGRLLSEGDAPWASWGEEARPAALLRLGGERHPLQELLQNLGIILPHFLWIAKADEEENGGDNQKSLCPVSWTHGRGRAPTAQSWGRALH